VSIKYPGMKGVLTANKWFAYYWLNEGALLRMKTEGSADASNAD